MSAAGYTQVPLMHDYAVCDTPAPGKRDECEHDLLANVGMA